MDNRRLIELSKSVATLLGKDWSHHAIPHLWDGVVLRGPHHLQILVTPSADNRIQLVWWIPGENEARSEVVSVGRGPAGVASVIDRRIVSTANHLRLIADYARAARGQLLRALAEALGVPALRVDSSSVGFGHHINGGPYLEARVDDRADVVTLTVRLPAQDAPDVARAIGQVINRDPAGPDP